MRTGFEKGKVQSVIEYEQIPPQIMAALLRYKDSHLNTGSFLRAVISNDLISAVQKADSESLKSLPLIASWAYTELPADAWGSYEAFQKWVERKI